MKRPLKIAITLLAIVPLLLFLRRPSEIQHGEVGAVAVRAFRSTQSVLRQPAFSSDGRLLAISRADGVVDVRRVADGDVIQTLRVPGGVTSVAFNPGGDVLVTGSYDNTVRLWQVNTGALLRTLSGHTGTIWSVAFSPDGQTIASSGEDATVRLWRASDGAPIRILRGHGRNVWSIAFSPDGQCLMSGSFDNTVRIWRVSTGELVRTLSGHTEAVVTVAYSPEGELIASGGDDATVRLWRARDGTLVRTIHAPDHVYTLSFTPDGKWLASGGRECGNLVSLWKKITDNRIRWRYNDTFRLWKVSDGSLQFASSAHHDDVRFLAVSPKGQWLATSSEDATTRLWRITENRSGV